MSLLFASCGQSTGAPASGALDPALVSPHGHLVGPPGRPLKRCLSLPSQLRQLSQCPLQVSLLQVMAVCSPTMSRTAPAGQAPYRLQVLSFVEKSVVKYLWERHEQIA